MSDMADDPNRPETEVDAIAAKNVRRQLARRKVQAAKFRANEAELQELLEFCAGEGRVCPKPREWDRLWQSLPGRYRDSTGWHPLPPLILAAWHATGDNEKRGRLAEQLRWAAAHGALGGIARSLRALPADKWQCEMSVGTMPALSGEPSRPPEEQFLGIDGPAWLAMVRAGFAMQKDGSNYRPSTPTEPSPSNTSPGQSTGGQSASNVDG